MSSVPYFKLIDQIAQKLKEWSKENPDEKILPRYKSLCLSNGYRMSLVEPFRNLDIILQWLEWQKPNVAASLKEKREQLERSAESIDEMVEEPSFLTIAFMKAKAHSLAEHLEHIAHVVKTDSRLAEQEAFLPRVDTEAKADANKQLGTPPDMDSPEQPKTIDEWFSLIGTDPIDRKIVQVYWEWNPAKDKFGPPCPSHTKIGQCLYPQISKQAVNKRVKNIEKRLGFPLPGRGERKYQEPNANQDWLEDQPAK